MCGIVGLFLKDHTLEPQLGSLLAGMLGTMCDRGPDSAGFAVYSTATSGAIKLTIRGPRARDYDAISAAFRETDDRSPMFCETRTGAHCAAD